MKIFKNKKTLIKKLNGDPNLSFIPTMGALHKGHLSLIKKAKKKRFKTLVSVFINPKQFERKQDFKRYPKNLRKDIQILKKEKIDYLFIPKFKDIFSFKSQNKVFLSNFSNKLCGKFRTGHFKGVLEVVNRFLEIIKPKYIYLGVKDFQQLVLISEHIKKRRLKTKVISCRIIREKNGLAISSRNKLLKTNEKNIAIKTINFLKNRKKKIVLKDINSITNRLLNFGVTKIDYIKIMDIKKLKYENKIKKNCNIFIAFFVNKIRLIDNF